MIINRTITMVAIFGGLISILLSIFYGSPLFTVMAAFFFTLTLILWKYGHLLIPFFTKAANIIEVRGSYEIPNSRDLIMKKSSNGYYATKFLEIRFYESTLDKNENEKLSMLESFEKVITSLKYIVKISMMISTLDLATQVEEIKTKRSKAEAKRAEKEKEGSDEVVKLDREIAMWNRLLERLTHGERAVELISYASTTAFGITRDEAISRANSQAKELKTILSSSMGCDVVFLSDADMIRCFEWEYFFPTSNENLKDEIF